MKTHKDLYLQERQSEIVRLVSEKERVSVSELSQRFGVSGVTIRSDLQTLANQGLLVRTHGGAVPNNQRVTILSLTARLQLREQEKRRIGRAAAENINDGDAIFLDTSSTTLAIAKNLKKHRYLTIITNSLAVAQEMLDSPASEVVMTGGRLRRDTASLVGTDGLEMLRDFHIQKGFFGVHGITLEAGLTDVSVDEAEVKRPLISMCHQVIAVFDSTKWGKIGLASFAELDQIDQIISDDAPVQLAEQVRSIGIELKLV
ncbi:MAG TPA: DeoR/GlpR family DNA-binding transcription regulator [candidate division Zixibacteria bacterium]|nr:DeoR/GlpR family DNA-binding transcription regulator [candidate division Zixibacteria bacterium]